MANLLILFYKTEDGRRETEDGSINHLETSVFSLRSSGHKKILISFVYWLLYVTFAPQYCGVEQW